MTHDLLAQAKQKKLFGRPDEALALLDSALARHPTDRDLLHQRAHTWLALKKPEQAERDLETLLTHFPHDAEALDDVGVLHQWRGDYLKAAEYHMRAVDAAPTDGALFNLGVALDHLGQKAEAEKIYALVLQINPVHTRAMTNRALFYDQRGQAKEAETLLQQAYQQGDTSFELAMAYGNLCRKQERNDEALRWYEKALAQRPGNAAAVFLISLLNGENPEAPPQEHIASLFDSYADHFETSLVDQLKYRTPDLLFNAAEKELVALKSKQDALSGMDLGAGTGLFGKIMRPFLAESIGLDLSAKMLAKAQEQAIYDDVLCLDMVEGLKRYPDGHFHVISAADVFVYLGSLDALFTVVHAALAPGGLFIFSTEAASSEEQLDYKALSTGRYAHGETYLKNLAAENGFQTVHFERTWIRYNKNEPLDGFIVVLKKD